MSVQAVEVECFCGRRFRTVRPHDALYGRLVSCGCLRSKDQMRLTDRIAKLGVEVVVNTRSALDDGQEIDIYLPQYKLGVEYNGLRWHSDQFRDKGYHLKKLQAAERSGIRLIQVFENEWLARPDVVVGFVQAVLGLAVRRAGARACDVRGSWTEVRSFLEEHHLQGAGAPGQFVRALWHDGQIVAAMVCRNAFTRNRPQEGRQRRWELVRYCVRSGWAVRGGFDRLWTAFLRERRPSEVVSFSDLRWSRGDLYRRAGFREDGTTPPSYWYWKTNQRTTVFHKSVFQKKKIEQKLGPLLPGETEGAAMRRFGYLRIWDCGLTRWVWTEGA